MKIIIKPVNDIEKKDFPKSVVSMQLGISLFILEQSDIEEVIKKLSKYSERQKNTDHLENTEQKALHIDDIMLCLELRLNIDTWGSYKKGDIEVFYIRICDEQNGLVRYPIDKRWDIISCSLVNAPNSSNENSNRNII